MVTTYVRCSHCGYYYQYGLAHNCPHYYHQTTQGSIMTPFAHTETTPRGYPSYGPRKNNAHYTHRRGVKRGLGKAR